MLHISNVGGISYYKDGIKIRVFNETKEATILNAIILENILVNIIKKLQTKMELLHLL